MPQEHAIIGFVAAVDGTHPFGFKVRAFDRDLPSLERRRGGAPQMLGEAATDGEGRFQLRYALEGFRAGDVSRAQAELSQSPDLSFRVFDARGRELRITRIEAAGRECRPDEIIFNAPPVLEVRITIDGTEETGDSEYERFMAVIAPVVQDVPLVELTDRDVEFLTNELGLEAQVDFRQRIQWLRWSALGAEETSLPIEAFYGWARTGLPDLWRELPSPDDEAHRAAALARLLDHLAAAAEEEIVEHLLKAVDERIIPRRIGERAGAIAQAIRRRKLSEVTVRLRLERTPGREPLAGYSVMTLDADANDSDLGSDVTDSRGEFEVVYYTERERAIERRLRFRVRGPGLTEAIEATARAKPGADESQSIAIEFPSSQPTLRQLSGDPRIDVPDDLVKMLEQSHGIRTLADIRRRGGLHRIRQLRELGSAAVRRLDSLADLDRLCSDPAEPIRLLEHFESVSAIAEAPRGEFVALLTKDGGSLSERRATELHIAARAQTDLLEQVFTGIAMDAANGIRSSLTFAEGDFSPPFPEEQHHD